jgi:hypothetical protein
MCLPPACFETGFGFVSGFEEGYWLVEEFFEKIIKSSIHSKNQKIGQVILIELEGKNFLRFGLYSSNQ